MRSVMGKGVEAGVGGEPHTETGRWGGTRRKRTWTKPSLLLMISGGDKKSPLSYTVRAKRFNSKRVQGHCVGEGNTNQRVDRQAGANSVRKYNRRAAKSPNLTKGDWEKKRGKKKKNQGGRGGAGKG